MPGGPGRRGRTAPRAGGAGGEPPSAVAGPTAASCWPASPRRCSGRSVARPAPGAAPPWSGSRGPRPWRASRRWRSPGPKHAGIPCLDPDWGATTRPATSSPILRPRRRGGHPLAVDRVERAHGVTHGHDPFREVPEAVVVPQSVFGRALAGDRRQGLGRRDRLVERRAPQAAGEVEEASLVGGRVVAVAPDQRDEPAPPLDRRDEAPAGRPGGPAGCTRPSSRPGNVRPVCRSARHSPGMN